MAPTGNVLIKKPLTSVAWVIQTTDDAVNGFLAGLSPVDFRTLADPKGVWAVVAADAGQTAGGFSGTAWVVSDEAQRRIKARRYSQSGQ